MWKKAVTLLLIGVTLLIPLAGCGSTLVTSPPVTIQNTEYNGALKLHVQSTTAEEAVVIDMMATLNRIGWISTGVVGAAAARVLILNIQTELTSWYGDAVFDDSGNDINIARMLNSQDIKGIADLYVNIQKLSDVTSLQYAVNEPAKFSQRLREEVFPHYLAGEHAANPDSVSCCSDISSNDAPVPAAPAIDYPQDAAQPPAEGYTEWRGKLPVGGDKGAWFNPDTADSLHPDLDHPEPTGPHWDWNTSVSGVKQKLRWFPDGRLEQVK